MNQIKHLFKTANTRWFCTSPKVRLNFFEHLKERTLLRVYGQESSEFLQGLITNDMNHLQNGVGCMYTMFLNTKGRVLYDAIIYKTPQEDAYLIECDVSGHEVLAKHLKIYRVKRKIDVESMLEMFNVYVVFDMEAVKVGQNKQSASKLGELIVPCDELNRTLPGNKNSVRIYKNLYIFQDPRFSKLGSRILAPSNVDALQEISELINVRNDVTPENNYRKFRYSFGVGEGLKDLPPGDCFPLEANCDYLHGISFHKGCYLGQELTARTHHTGVIRKRLMPLYFSKIPTKVPEDNKIVHENTNLGKLRGVEGDVGLGLLRVAKALDFNEFKVGNGIARTLKPPWWPLEAPKERLNVA